MPRRKNGEFPLPDGWEEGRDFDGKVFYINHNTQQTTWIDPRDRYADKPFSLSRSRHENGSGPNNFCVLPAFFAKFYGRKMIASQQCTHFPLLH